MDRSIFPRKGAWVERNGQLGVIVSISESIPVVGDNGPVEGQFVDAAEVHFVDTAGETESKALIPLVELQQASWALLEPLLQVRNKGEVWPQERAAELGYL